MSRPRDARARAKARAGPAAPTAPRPDRPSPPPAEPVPLRHAAWLFAALVAAACVAISVSFEIYEKDFWQHLVVGRAIWERGHVPTTQLWTWPTHGAPDVNSSWGFRVLIWPLWSALGVWGLFLWRWVTALAAFGLAFAVARRLGARGFTTLVVIALCALTYRQRSHVRPETLAAVLLALQLWVLETRRQGGRDRAWLLVPIAWAWINTHISYHLGFLMIAVHLVDGWWARGRGRQAPSTRHLLLSGVASLAISFVNPFGWRALWQPFDFFLHQRHEPIFQGIFELRPLDLGMNLMNLLPLVVFGWPLLALWRWRRQGFDLVEGLLLAVFLGLSFMSQRFLGFTMIVAVPYLARDLDAWVRARPWPAWTRPVAARAALAGVTCVGIGLVEWARDDLPLRIGIREREFPVAALDWVARHDVRGRAFNQFHNGGYLLWRFWPDSSRLPFMDIHQAGTPRDRYAYAHAASNPEAWRELDARYRFDWVILRRVPYPGDQMVEILDADPAYAIAFMDDAGVLYLRRDGADSALARAHAYRWIAAGARRMAELNDSLRTSRSAVEGVRAELEREAAGSRWNALANTRLGALRLAEGDVAAARKHLDAALASDPRAPRAREWLGRALLAQGEPREALRRFDEAHRLEAWDAGYGLRRGQALQALGDLAGARRAYEREVNRDPGNAEARDSLAALSGR